MSQHSQTWIFKIFEILSPFSDSENLIEPLGIFGNRNILHTLIHISKPIWSSDKNKSSGNNNSTNSGTRNSNGNGNPK